VKTVPVGFRVHRDGFQAEVAAGTEDAERDFTAIGNQYLAEHGLDRVEI
jgi:hypothetical protein